MQRTTAFTRMFRKAPFAIIIGLLVAALAGLAYVSPPTFRMLILVTFLWVIGKDAVRWLMQPTFGLPYLRLRVGKKIGWLEGLKKPALPRNLASLLVSFSFTFGFFGAMAWLIPNLYESVHEFARILPGWYDMQVAPMVLEEFGFDASQDRLLAMAPEHLGSGLGIAQKVLQYLGWTLGVLLSNLLMFIVVPYLVYRMLAKEEALLRWGWKFFNDITPDGSEEAIATFFGDCNKALTRLVSGQVLVVVIMSTFYATSLEVLVGLSGGLLIGVVAGMFTMLPTVGPAIAAVIALGVGAIQFGFGDPMAWVLLGTTLGIGALVESYALTPKIVSEKLGLDDFFIVVALMVGFDADGVFGMFMALPMLAFATVIVKHLYRWFLTQIKYGDQRSIADIAELWFKIAKRRGMNDEEAKVVAECHRRGHSAYHQVKAGD